MTEMIEVTTEGEPEAPPKTAANGACAQCGEALDRLRAERVALIDWRFQYFCSDRCEQVFRTRVVMGIESASADSAAPRISSPPPLAVSLRATETSSPFPVASPETASATMTPRSVQQRTLRMTALALAAIQLTLGLAGTTTWPLLARVGLSASALVTLGWAERLSPKKTSELTIASVLYAPFLLCSLLAGAALTGSGAAQSLADAAALTIAGIALCQWFLASKEQALDADLLTLIPATAESVDRVCDGQTIRVQQHDLRPGHEIVLGTGDRVPVDAVISAGSARVQPWLAVEHSALCHEGDALLAGARILDGTVRAVVTWTGHDRALLRLLVAPDAAAEAHCPASRWSMIMATRLSWLSGAVLLGVNLLLRESWEQTLAVSVVAAWWLSNPVCRRVAALELRRAALIAASEGIAFHDASAFDRAGQVSIAVFCSRSTVLTAYPELVAVESLSRSSTAEVFALAAGALCTAPHPNALALCRAAVERNVAADAARNHDHLPGLGVTCVSAKGQNLVVGNRTLMLKQKISIAAAEKRIAELEGSGLTVLLIALGEHLIGFVALQDPVRRGARAAVQALQAAHIEPVLLSGDSRETCEAMGKAIGFQHIRPELPPADRPKEITRLSDAGAVVAVIGRNPTDQPAMGAADVSLALASAGSTTPGIDIMLASDSLYSAARALILARRTRRAGSMLLIAAILPGSAGLSLAFLGVPLAVTVSSILSGMALGLTLPRFWASRSTARS